MQTLNSISKRYAINSHNEAYYTLELTELATGKSDAFTVFGSLEDIVNTMDASVYNVDPDADPAQYRAVISHSKNELVVMPTCAGPDSAIITAPQPAPQAYEIRQVDAWHDGESWTYNESLYIGSFTTAGDVPRAFRRALAKLGITFYRGRTATEYDGDVYEIVDRATREPLFAAIPEA